MMLFLSSVVLMTLDRAPPIHFAAIGKHWPLESPNNCADDLSTKWQERSRIVIEMIIMRPWGAQASRSQSSNAQPITPADGFFGSEFRVKSRAAAAARRSHQAHRRC
jgi:hypothetical protein